MARGLAIAALLVGTWCVLSAALNLPPVLWMLEYGPPSAHGPTGRTAIVQKVEFVEIAPGYFRMGSALYGERADPLDAIAAAVKLEWGKSSVRSGEMPVRWVRFPDGFWIARYELTNEAYQRYDPSHRQVNGKPVREIDPVDYVTWEEAKRYCAWLSARSGLPVGLPTEAEFECACRAGTRTEYPCGDDPAGLLKFAWDSANSEKLPHPVGLWAGNAWGLHDLTGNQTEWCEDALGLAPPSAPGPPAPAGFKPAWSPDRRVVRGGSWATAIGACRSASRSCLDPREFRRDLGFRPAFVLPAGMEWAIQPYLVPSPK